MPFQTKISAQDSENEIKKRLVHGEIAWTGPLVLVMARPALFLLLQAALAIVFALLHRPSAWRSAGAWWSVYGTVVDLGCLGLLARFTKREHIGIRDLIGKVRLRGGRDILAGIGLFLLIFPAFMGGSFVSSLLIYGSWDPERNLYLLNVRTLPLWGVVYSFAAWWLISAATEETTYQGYVLPRIEALSGHSWVAVVVVVFWWTMQHCALPLVPDFKYLAFRFVAFLPGVTLLTLIYVRIRRPAADDPGSLADGSGRSSHDPDASITRFAAITNDAKRRSEGGDCDTCRYKRINPKTLQCIPARAGSEAVRTGSTRGIGQLLGSTSIGSLNFESILPT